MDIMRITKQPTTTVSRNASLGSVVAKMVEEDAGAVIVVEEGAAVGIFTRRDVVRLIHDGRSLDSSAADNMSAPVTVLERGTEVDEALETMTKEHIHHLPVVDSNGQLLGVIDTSAALKRLVYRLNNELDSLESYFGSDSIGG